MISENTIYVWRGLDLKKETKNNVKNIYISKYLEVLNDIFPTHTFFFNKTNGDFNTISEMQKPIKKNKGELIGKNYICFFVPKKLLTTKNGEKFLASKTNSIKEIVELFKSSTVVSRAADVEKALVF